MKKIVSAWAFLLLVIGLTGCWDVQDITNRAYITAIGLDHAREGAAGEYKVSFEIVLPNKLFERSGDQKATLNQTIEAPSIGTAVERLQARISRPLSLAHLRVLLIGETLAKEKNFLDIADFFQRNPNIQKRIRLLFVQKAEAEDILETKPIYENYIARELVSMSQVDYAQSRNTSFLDFVAELRAKDGKGFGMRGLVSSEENLLIRHGGAIFDQWRLRGWLSSEETEYANWIVGDGEFTLDAKREKSTYTYLIDKKSVKITPTQQNGRLGFAVTLKTAGALMQEQGDHVDASKPEALRQLESLFARTIKEQVESAIAKAQKHFHIDYLGFDTALQKSDLRMYQKLNWSKVFPDLPITVEVKTKISSFGLSK